MALFQLRTLAMPCCSPSARQRTTRAVLALLETAALAACNKHTPVKPLQQVGGMRARARIAGLLTCRLARLVSIVEAIVTS